MVLFTVTLKHKKSGQVYTHDIPGHDEADTRAYAEVLAGTYDGWDIVSLVEKAPIPPGTSFCHYCGQVAKSRGFFDEPVCSECGG